MSKAKKILSLAMALLIVLNIFSVTASAVEGGADYSALEEYISVYVPSDNDAGIYSEQSYAALTDVLGLIDYDLTAENQETVDGYLASLKSAVSALEADETKATAVFAVESSTDTVHPGDVIDVTVSLNTNYKVVAAGAVLIYDSSVFELVTTSNAITGAVDVSESTLNNYVLTGSHTATDAIFASRNSNTAYWTSDAAASYKAVNIGLAVNSKATDPVAATGAIATIQFKVLDSVEYGTAGSIFMSSDFNKTTDFAGGLNFASRCVGDKMGSLTACIAAGQTIDLTNANATVEVKHTLGEEANCTDDQICEICGEVIVAALGHKEGEYAEEEIDGVLYNVQRCTVCGEILAQEAVAFADYTAVEEAIVAAEALEAILYTNYSAVEAAINAVVYDLYAKDQEIVNGYAAAINEAVAGLVKVVDELNVTNDGSVTQEGDTIYIDSVVNAGFIAMYNTGKVTGTAIDLDMLDGTFRLVSKNTRYYLDRVNVEFGPEEQGKSQGSVATTMVINGQTYNIVFTFNKLILKAENIRTLSVYETFVDNEAKTITLNTKQDASQIIFWAGTADFTFEIDESKYEEVTHPYTYRYYIAKPADKQSVVEVEVNGEVYTMTVNFVESPFAPNKYMQTVYGGVELGSIAVNDELTDAIVVTMTPGKTYVGLRTEGISGATLDITYEGVEGLTLAKTAKGVEFVKAVSETGDDIVTSMTVTLSDGTVLEYPLVFRFADTTVSLNAIQTVNIESAKSVYDKDNKTMTFYSSSSSYVRFRNWLTNGLVLTVDTDKYSFIEEINGFYHIGCPFSKTATFEMSFSDPDNTVVTATVYFFGYETEPLATNLLTTVNGSVVSEGTSLSFRIATKKTKMTINETLSNGEILTINADDYSFVTYADGVYTITYKGVGSTIDFTVSGVTYTATVSQVS